MGNKSNGVTAASSAESNSIPITKSATPTTFSTAITTTATPKATVAATTVTPTAATTAATATTMTITSAPTTTTATTTTATTTTTTAATTTTPTPAITSTIPTSTTGAIKPTFSSVAKSLTADTDKAKSASLTYAHWYKWSKLEQQKREKGKVFWYMGSPITKTDPFSLTTTTLTTTTAKIDDDTTRLSDSLNISAVPSFLLRSTAVYSPPHGDRILPGRNELINTDTSAFKYYIPENRSKQTGGIHTKATMYKMDTQSRQTPLPTQSSALINNDRKQVTGHNAPLPKFVSHDLQTDLKTQPNNSSSSQIPYYEKQQSQIVRISGLSKSNSISKDPTSKPVLPPIETTSVWVNDQPYSSMSQPPPPSILKKSSTVLSREISNPLSEQTHDKALEELRKRNKNTKDDAYRINKVHLLEKNIPENHPATVKFDLPPSSHRPTKANQSISRSERLFFSQLFNRKK